MSTQYPLNETLSPISREERNKLNANWQRITGYFDAVQLQIKVLSGGKDVDELIKRLEQAIETAEVALQQYITEVDVTLQEAIAANNANLATALKSVEDAIGRIDTAILSANTATQDAITAKNAANQATKDAQDAINAMTLLINNFVPRGLFASGTQYYKNNIVADAQGNSYIARVDNINVGLVNTATWMLFAKKGDKGDKGEKGDTGAALSIKGSLTNPSQLPPTGTAGDAYTINGELWVWSDNTKAWENVGNIKGEKGDTGATGEPGKSAYQIAVEDGFIGTEHEWIASLKGEKGDTPDLTPIEESVTEIGKNLKTHESEIATIEKLGHIKSDGVTTEVGPDGTLKVIGGAGSTVLFEGDLNDLTESGFYSVPENTPNAPNTLPLLVEVRSSSNGKFIIQTATYDHIGASAIPSFTRRAIKNELGVFVWSKPTPGAVGFIGDWRIVDYPLSDDITDNATNRAATVNAVKQVNDKISSANIASSVFAPFQNEIGTGLRYRVMGNIVSVGGTIRVTQTSTNNTICHMPSNISPNSFVPFVVLKQRGSTHSYVHGFLNSGGVMGIDGIYMSGMAVGDVLNIGFTYNTKVN